MEEDIFTLELTVQRFLRTVARKEIDVGYYLETIFRTLKPWTSVTIKSCIPCWPEFLFPSIFASVPLPPV